MAPLERPETLPPSRTLPGAKADGPGDGQIERQVANVRTRDHLHRRYPAFSPPAHRPGALHLCYLESGRQVAGVKWYSASDERATFTRATWSGERQVAAVRERQVARVSQPSVPLPGLMGGGYARGGVRPGRRHPCYPEPGRRVAGVRRTCSRVASCSLLLPGVGRRQVAGVKSVRRSRALPEVWAAGSSRELEHGRPRGGPPGGPSPPLPGATGGR